MVFKSKEELAREEFMRQMLLRQQMIPPHRHVPNPVTGNCMICGIREHRIL